MAQLHEILAVESSLGKAADKLMQESRKTLGKENLFMGATRTLKMFDTESEHLNTKESVNLETTVDENIDYLIDPVGDYWDAILQKDLTNQTATADIIIDGQTIAAGLPATFLLNMETKLGELRRVYDSIHTLAPGIKWEIDRDHSKMGVFTANENETFKTEKMVEFVIAAEATEQHPAQVREVPKTTNVGKYSLQKWCGLLSPLEKAMRIQRLDKLIRAVKKARQRANKAEIVNAHVAGDLFSYINGING